MNLSEAFVDRLHRMAVAGLPAELRHRAKRCLLDYLGCTLAGARMLRAKTDLPHLLDAIDSGVCVVGFGRSAGLVNAALLNGMSAHAVELDDGDRYGMMHPGAPVLSALLPLAQQEAITGARLLDALVVGYEAALSLARAVQPVLKDRGYHATGVCGTIGAAMGSMLVLNGSAGRMKDALSAATTAASGILKVIRDGSELKPFTAGQAAMNGLCAALVAQAGFRGPDDPLGGDGGFLSLLSPHAKETLLAHGGDRPAIERIYVKPYAACRHCHAPIEAAFRIRAAAGEPGMEEIEAVRVETHRWAVHLHDHTDIGGVTSAKMSVPYSVAVALETGRAGLAEFDEARIADPDTLALTRKVNVAASEALTALVPGKRAAIVEMDLRDGRRFNERVDLPKGEPETPMTDEELEAKFIDLAIAGGRTREQAKAIVACVWNVEERLAELWGMIG